MDRPVLPAERVSHLADAVVAKFHRGIVDEVVEAIAKNEWVVVGMAQNPVVPRARKQLDEAGIPYRYIGHGSYLSKWKQRLALKLWAGFPTFPMVFHQGKLVGGASELKVFLAERGSEKSQKSEKADQPPPAVAQRA